MVDHAVTIADLPMDNAFMLGYAVHKERIVADTRELQVLTYGDGFIDSPYYLHSYPPYIPITSMLPSSF